MKIGLIVLVLFNAFCNAFSYWNMRCPSQSEWGVISSWVCNGTETKKYTCLYNAIRRQYEESCKFQPVISGNGSQYVISVYPNSEPCRNYDRYQPFPLGSNAGSDCVFQKSTCSEEGNILFHHGSPKTDLSCRCNFQKGFGFVNEIPNRCDCIPSQEDCSCYLKQCPLGHRLISDYACLHEDDRKHIVKCPEMGPENSRKMTTHLRQLSSKELKNIEFLNRRIDFIGLTCLTGICIVYAIVASLLIITNKIPKMCYIDICPFNLEITPDGSSLRISWSISDKVPTIDIFGYNIYFTYNGQWEQLEVRKPSKQYSFYKPKPSKTYRFKVSTVLRNMVESKCTEENTFNTELPITPKVGTPKGENSKIVLTWNSPRNTLIQIEGYEIQWSIDDWLTIADKKNVASNVLRHEIETATEGVTYQIEICSFSNSVKSLYEIFEPFSTRHDTFTMEVAYDTYDQKDKVLVQNNVNERFKRTCNGFPGDQKKIHQSESEGSIVVTIMFISEGFTDEKVLHDTFKNTFQKKMIGSDTIKFKSFWLKRMNDPSPPQNVKASSVNNGVLVSWKEPFITFFKTKKYVVEYMEDGWKYPGIIVVPDDENSCFITKVLPSANIRVKVYTCICHKCKSSKSPAVSTVVKENTSTLTRRSTIERELIYHTTHAASDLAMEIPIIEKASSNTDTAMVLYRKDIISKIESPSKAVGEKTTIENITNSSRRNVVKEEMHCQELTILAIIKMIMVAIGMHRYIRLLHDNNLNDNQTMQIADNKYISTSRDQGEVKQTHATMSSVKEKTWIRTIKDKGNEKERQEVEWNDSIWLVKILDDIGANNEYRKICQEQAIFSEILVTFSTGFTYYRVGNTCEGTATPGEKFEQIAVQSTEKWPVVEDISKVDRIRSSLLIVGDSETPSGYVKLQLVVGGVPCMLNHWPLLCALSPIIQHYFKTDKFERIVLFDIVDMNKPKVLIDNHMLDEVQCYRCKTWPAVAHEWLLRTRCNGWPSEETIDELKTLGFFVVKESYPFSQEINLQWRIYFALQERQLIFNLTDVQYKCYVILTMLNRDVLQIDCITSYHWKTCLFYIIEENQAIVWERKLLFHCVRLCIKRMLVWVKRGYCPDYFISTENMFKGKMIYSLRVLLENKLEELLKVGFDCLLQVHSNNLCDFVKSRNISKWYEELQVKRKRIFQNDVYTKKVDICHCAMTCLGVICEHHNDHMKITNVIEVLWHMLCYIKRVHIVSEHTPQETRRALSILQPLIYTSLASNISAMCIQQPNLHVRDFLLFGCYSFFMKGDIHGRLKFISLLYAVGCYKECKWYLDQTEREYAKYNPSVKPSKTYLFDNTLFELSQVMMSTCLIFLPTELPITPDVLKIEMFRYIGISSHNINIKDSWAVIDSKLYYFFLKYLINRKIMGDAFSIDTLLDINQMAKLMYKSNIKHRDVYYNLMSWCFRDIGFTIIALDMLRMSWHTQRSLDSMIVFRRKKMRQKHYLFNSAKIHALVILYNIWFTKKPSCFKFCFECFDITHKAMQTCDRCKTVTYCSNQCKNKNKLLHKAVCGIVRRYCEVKETILYERI